MSTLIEDAQAVRQVCDICEQERPCVEDEATGDLVCESCRQNAAEAAYERSQSDCFRGNEYAGYLAAQQDQARRLK